jgi:hypothetical protein
MLGPLAIQRLNVRLLPIVLKYRVNHALEI